ncbi:MAG: hypothetical protein RBR86_09605 [Pseudobdellovibrionaceae bacterium]|jgi:hypothetical protein|nr:hypothetical protein [Pseudobdellovibrionaceae bacterium]
MGETQEKHDDHKQIEHTGSIDRDLDHNEQLRLHEEALINDPSKFNPLIHNNGILGRANKEYLGLYLNGSEDEHAPEQEERRQQQKAATFRQNYASMVTEIADYSEYEFDTAHELEARPVYWQSWDQMIQENPNILGDNGLECTYNAANDPNSEHYVDPYYGAITLTQPEKLILDASTSINGIEMITNDVVYGQGIKSDVPFGKDFSTASSGTTASTTSPGTPAAESAPADTKPKSVVQVDDKPAPLSPFANSPLNF